MTARLGLRLISQAFKPAPGSPGVVSCMLGIAVPKVA